MLAVARVFEACYRVLCKTLQKNFVSEDHIHHPTAPWALSLLLSMLPSVSLTL